MAAVCLFLGSLLLLAFTYGASDILHYQGFHNLQKAEKHSGRWLRELFER
jgi:hypothetical protein